MKQQWN